MCNEEKSSMTGMTKDVYTAMDILQNDVVSQVSRRIRDETDELEQDWI